VSPTPPDTSPELLGILTAVKPVYWAAVTVAGCVWAASTFLNAMDARMTRIETDVQDIKYILCATAPATTDSACRGIR
jgi:hypothetical protein